MEETKGYPKYQYSIFLKNGKDSQLVVREDDFTRFTKAILEIQQLVESNKQENVPAQAMSLNNCPVHKVEMKPKINKADGSTFYSHARQRADGNGWEYCNGKGFASERGAVHLDTVREATGF